MSLLEKATLITTPTAHSNGTLHSIKGGAIADFDVVRGSAATRVNAEGLIEDISILSGELITQPVNLVTDFDTNSGGVIIDADTFETFGGSIDGLKKAFLTIGKSYRLVIEGDTTSSGFTIGNISASGNEYGSGFGTHYFTATVNTTLWIRQATAGVTNITSLSLKEVTEATNIPRIDYTTGEGVVLLEPQSTNLCFSSNVLAVVGAGVVTPNAATSPDGTLNATSVNFNTGINDGARIIVGGSSATALTNYTISFYAKNVSGDGTFRVRVDTNSQSSLVNETFTATSEWVRYTHTFTTDASATTFGVGSRFRKGTDNNEILLYGVQLEALSYATSYIPTSGAIATRLADSVSGAGDVNTFNSTEGVLYAEIAALANDGIRRYMSLSDGTSNNDVRLYFDAVPNKLIALGKVSGATQFVMDTTSFTLTDFNKIALKYKENDFALWVNGVQVDTDTSGLVNAPNTINELAFDGNGLKFYGKVKALAVFNEALTDSELECLTKI